MLSSIQNNLAAAAQAAANAQTLSSSQPQGNSQTVSVQLDSQLFSFLYDALLQAGLDPGSLGLPGAGAGQDSGTSQNSGGAMPPTTNPVSVILPSPVVIPLPEPPVPETPAPPASVTEPVVVVPPVATPGGTTPPVATSAPLPVAAPVVTPFGVVPPEAFDRAAQSGFTNPFGRDPVPVPVSPPVSKPPSWTPVFQNASMTGPDGQSWPLNSSYFATLDTAGRIAQMYGTGEVVTQPAGGTGGPFGANAQEYHIRLEDGRLVNAGMLASYYVRNPDNLYPGVADRLIRNLLASEAPASA